MADTKISGLTAVTTAAGASEFAVNEAATSKKITLSQITTYSGPIFNSSVAQQGAGFAADTYLTGSNISIPSGRLQAKTIYRCMFDVSKTGAGTAAPIITVRIGTLGTTGDAAITALTFAAQTGAIDTGVFEIYATYRTVGAGTSAVVQSAGSLIHILAATGLANVASSTTRTTSSGFNSTTGTVIGLSVNGGTSASWTVQLVQAELRNLAP